MNKQIISKILLGLLFAISCTLPTATAQDLSTVIVSANSEYNSGNFEQAAVLYQKALNAGATNGHIFYNLANAQYRLGAHGKAIANYRRARLEFPRNPDIAANLSLARSKAIDRVEDENAGASLLGAQGFLFLNAHFSRYEMSILGLAFYSLFWLGVLLYSFHPSRLLRNLNIGTCALTIIWSVLIFGVREDQQGDPVVALNAEARSVRPAVVSSPEVRVHSGNSETFQVIFILHDGAEVLAGEQREQWVEVRLPAGRRGWVQQEFIELL